ncbi:MAG: T9SS type A sorting domain-containing protein [Ignavibacterium album]|uniref:T9SS type A sorting domain-containing protein n=1 Tax=Ignavibacterium album TaxID=591197 RepID=UPI0026EF5C47|nr:T9SS type A sorting domain-containing protein [Ignavibacterium album]MCX8105706.1 T9SS type A sorting domain-containing protein [Ignavibacterium album]
MKKLFTLLFAFLIILDCYSQVTTLWEKSAATSSLPGWFSSTGSTERGLGYGLVGGNHRIYIASRNGGNFIFIYNALTGDSVGSLSTNGISGGTYLINDIGVSNDGLIFVCNLTTNASTSPFKIYKYTTELDSPVVAIEYTSVAAARLGDKITVTGSASDNSLTIWAASANTQELYKFTTTDNGNTFTANIIPLAGLTGATFGSASVGPITGNFYWNAGGFNPKKYNADGSLVGTIPGSVVTTGSNAIRFITNIIGDEYIATFAFGSGNENARIVKVPGGDPTLATLVGTTTTLGTNSNSNGTGDVEVRKVSKYIYQIFVLSTNNGFGAYQVNLTPTLSGNYYIGNPGTGPGGSNPNFATLGEAFDVIYDATIAGDCNFYITSDVNEPNTGGVGIGLAKDPGSYILTFKPYTGVQPVITLNYPSDGNSGPSGAMIIGIPTRGNISWDSMKTTRNIVFDGSNSPGGTTRDLTIQTSTTAHRNSMPLVIVGDVASVVIKNTKIYYRPQTISTAGNLFIGAVMVRSRNYLGQDWVPHDLLFENNHLSSNFDGVAQNAQGYGTYQSGTPLPLNFPFNIVLKGNLIEGKRRGISLYISGSHDILNNEIKLNQNIAASTTNEAIYAVNVDTGSVVNIYNNKISQVSSMTNAANNGNTAISIESFGTYNVYNNFITGFELTSTNPTAYLYGIKNSSATATLNCYFNSINMNDIVASGTITYNGILISNGTNDLANNIIYSAEGDFANYCIYRSGTNGTFTSNYNNFYPVSSTNGNVGFWNNAATPTLGNWQTASGQDANSKSKQVFFVSTTDLHLTGSSIGDLDLAGTPVSGITTDIDGETRHPQFPYMGADEGSTPLPVELVSFSANASGSKIKLSWITASELNNRGFEVERSINGNFEVIGFVAGRGTTTEKQSYSFIDNNPAAGIIRYRLKQIDFDGTYSYSSVIEVDFKTPTTFDLAQNYPNPFNPTTTIRYSIANAVNVSLVIYNTLGEEVMTLVNNQFTEPGVYNVVFDASNLASGTYIYRLTAGDFVMTKKMVLTK